MKIEEAIEILERHNEWRRGADIPMAQPSILGEAIDIVIKSYKEMINGYGWAALLGKNILKHQFEVYTPLRKYVVEVPNITMEFDKAGVDIVENKPDF